MKRVLGFLVLTIFMFSFVSAGVTMETAPKNLYNLGEKIEFNIKVVSDGLFSEVVALKLSCGTLETEVYKEYLYLEEDTSKKIIIPLVKDFIGESKGLCAIYSNIGGESTKLSNDFTISHALKFSFNSPTESLVPGENFVVGGTVYRENGEPSNGVIEARLKNGEEEILATSEVVSGVFNLDFSLPLGFEAGDHVVNIYSYELDSKGEITNLGSGIDPIFVKQVPTNIEVVLEEKKLIAGEDSLEARVLLHDQSGEKIDSVAYVAIKDGSGDIVERLEVQTDVLIEYPFNYTESPAFWSVGAYSGDLINKVQFEILENKKVDFELVNHTLLVKNNGNVPYDGVVDITLGDQVVPLEVNLGVGEEQKYVLSAPNGEYEVKVGDISQRVSLTGRAIDVKKYERQGIRNFSIVWVFMVFILGFVAYTIFRKGYKKSFFGRIRKKKKVPEDLALGDTKSFSKKDLITPNTRVELSLSIAGTKQNAVVGCIALKNFDEIKSGEGNVHETLENIVNMVESRKGLIYKNHGNLFYIFAPVMTKTFKNEELALDVTNNILDAFKEHNKKFKQKIDYGIALNYGTIVTRIEVRDVKFMSMGTLMTTLKKLSTASEGKLYLGEKVKERLAARIKSVRKELGSLDYYEFKELTKKTDHSPFIKGFMERQQKERIAKENAAAKEKFQQQINDSSEKKEE